MRRRWILTAAALWCSGDALAWPVDLRVDVEAGREQFQRLSSLDWFEVEDPKIATAEVLPSGELLVSGHQPGRTRVLLYAEGRMAVWLIRVSPRGQSARDLEGSAALTAAKSACPGLKVPAAKDESLEVTIRDEKCRQALLALFQTDRFLARELALTFEVPALQAQHAAILKALEKERGGRTGQAEIQAKYRGAGLELTGAVSGAEHRRALWAIFRNTAGRVAIDDQIQVQPSSSKGTP